MDEMNEEKDEGGMKTMVQIASQMLEDNKKVSSEIVLSRNHFAPSFA